MSPTVLLRTKSPYPLYLWCTCSPQRNQWPRSDGQRLQDSKGWQVHLLGHGSGFWNLMWGWWKYGTNSQKTALMMPFSTQKSCSRHRLSCLSVTVRIVLSVTFILKFVSYIQKTLQHLSLNEVLWNNSGIFMLFQTNIIELLKHDCHKALHTLLEKHCNYNAWSDPWLNWSNR